MQCQVIEVMIQGQNPVKKIIEENLTVREAMSLWAKLTAKLDSKKSKCIFYMVRSK